MALTIGVVLLAGCVPESVPPVPQPAKDAAVVARNVVPAGSFSPPSFGDVGREARMYDSITPLGGDVDAAAVEAGFKPAGLTPPADVDVRLRERPRSGLQIDRDEFNVPYITADTDELAIWGTGWVAADHNPFAYEIARRNGRLAAADLPNVNPVREALDYRTVELTAAADAPLVEQIDRLLALGPEGRAVVADIDAFVAGYNARLDSILSPFPRWTRLDVVALAAFKAEWWGRGQLAFPASLSGATRAALAPPAPTSPELEASAIRVPSTTQSAPASNFALISGRRSTTGHPLLIGGPQIGYAYPGVAFEVVLNSPSLHMRGLTAPSLPGYVFIGRGEDFAFTINSGLNEVTGAVAVVPTCGPGVGWYRVGSACRAVESVPFGSWVDLPGARGTAPAPPVLERTVFGPVLGYSFDEQGTPSLYVVQRPSAGWDVLDLVAYRRVNVGGVSGPEDFREALLQSPQAFYAGYVDRDHIAAFTTGWHVGPATGNAVADVSTLRLPSSQLAYAVDPAGGLITNWNEVLRSGPGGEFVPPDPDGSRRDWFERFDQVPTHSPASAVGAMNDMATRYTDPSWQWSFSDLSPFEPGPRPAPIRATNRSTGIQQLMSFGDAER